MTADPAAAAVAAAAVIADEARSAVDRRERFILALSGGSTPAALYRLLASREHDDLPWGGIHLIWGDERCVPPDDPRSNYALVLGSGLLSRPLAGIHRMRGEDPPEREAERYASVLEALATETAGRAALGRGDAPRGGAGPDGPAASVPDLPLLDLALLGLGDDGHTASLFPGSALLGEARSPVAAAEERDGVRRLTLTPVALRGARRLLFLVVGAGKRSAVRAVLEDRDPEKPATVVAEAAARVTWVLDEAAASGLRPRGC